MAGYYYRQLNKAEQAVYEMMAAGFRNLSSAIRVPKLSNEALSEVYQKLKLDEPRLFYVVGFTYRFYQGADHVELLPEYLFDKNKIRTHQQAIDARLARLTRDWKSKSEEERELAIHDFILGNVRYDKLKKSYSHEIIGPLTQGVGVCEGIAKTVKMLCDAVGLECVVALSEANPEAGIKYRHAWNVIKVNGKRYHVDATFDNSLQCGEPRYDYFNLDDRHIFRDHQSLVYPVPACNDADHFYYRKMSFTKMEDVENRVKQALRKKKQHFVFHWRGGGLNRSIVGELVERCGTLAAQKNKAIACRVNMAQAVLQLDFTDEVQTAVTIEQPDEGNEL